MSKEIEVYVHGEGATSLRLLKINEEATIADLLQLAQKSGSFEPSDAHHFKICLEDEDKMHEHHQVLRACGIRHKSHVHCHRCQHINVSISYNGVVKSRSFGPSTTGKNILRWALHEFELKGPDAVDKVLRLSDKDVLDADAHIGTLAKFPACSVELSLTAKVEVQG